MSTFSNKHPFQNQHSEQVVYTQAPPSVRYQPAHDNPAAGACNCGQEDCWLRKDREVSGIDRMLPRRAK
jgi:hypothetical protein